MLINAHNHRLNCISGHRNWTCSQSISSQLFAIKDSCSYPIFRTCYDDLVFSKYQNKEALINLSISNNKTAKYLSHISSFAARRRLCVVLVQVHETTVDLRDYFFLLLLPFPHSQRLHNPRSTVYPSVLMSLLSTFLKMSSVIC